MTTKGKGKGNGNGKGKGNGKSEIQGFFATLRMTAFWVGSSACALGWF
jgi:hypothetical protein